LRPGNAHANSVKQLLATGTVAHTFIGLGTKTLTAQIAQELHANVSSGVAVTTVVASSPAAASGMRPGDVITQFESLPLETSADLVLAVREHKPGDMIALHYVRNGSSRKTNVTLTSRAT
jgi:serine protease Do